MRECYVAPYALVDVIRALNNEDIWDIWVTKFDGHLLVRWHIKDENKQYLSNAKEKEIQTYKRRHHSRLRRRD